MKVVFLSLLLVYVSAGIIEGSYHDASRPLTFGRGQNQMSNFPGGVGGTFNVQGRYMVVDSSPFKNTIPPSPQGTLDHSKWLAFVNERFVIPTDGQELVLTVSGTAQTYGTRANPFGVNQNDPRLASAAINSIDVNTYLVVDFFITNDKIYALYERLPFGRSATNYYSAFTYLIPVADRIYPNEQFNLQIAYNGKDKYVRYVINGREVFRIHKLGLHLDGPGDDYLVLDLGGKEQEVFPKSVQFGFGTFSLLDAIFSCTKNIKNGVLQSCPRPPTATKGLVKLVTTPNAYYYPGTSSPAEFETDGSNVKSRLFGQGADLKLLTFSVSTDVPNPEPVKFEQTICNC